MGIKTPKHTIFDNYIDSVDNDFIKKLSSDYIFLDYGYRVYISENKLGTTYSVVQKSLWKTIIDFVIKLFIWKN